MAKLWDAQDGVWVKAPDDQVRDLVLSGRYEFDDAETIPVLNPDGKAGTISGKDAADYFASGFQFETGEQRGYRKDKEEFGEGFGNELAAGLAGAGRGLTFGLSDQVLTKTGLVEDETLSKLKEFNPAASVGGEIAGAVAPLLLSGGTSAAATGASAAKTGLGLGRAASGAARGIRAAGALPRAAARIGLGAEKALLGTGAGLGRTALAKGVGAAAEGALYGAGQLVSEEALGDADMTAEHVINTVGMGALVGGFTGGAFGVLEAGAKAGAKGVSGALKNKFGSVDDFVKGRRRDAALSATNATPGKLAKAQDRAKADSVADVLSRELDDLGGEAVIKPGMSATQIKDRVDTAMDAVGSRKTRLVKQIDEIVPEQQAVSADSITRRLKERFEDALYDSQGVALPQAKKSIKKLDDAIEEIRRYADDAGAIGIRRGDELVRNLQKQAKKAYEKIPANRTFKDELLIAQARAARSEVDDTIAVALEGTPHQNLAKEYIEAKQTYSDLADALDLVDSGAKRIANNRSISITDYAVGAGGLAGGIAIGGPIGLATAAAGAVGNKLMRERGDSVLLGVWKAVERSTGKIDDSLDKFVARSGAKKARKFIKGAAIKGATKKTSKALATTAEKSSPSLIVAELSDTKTPKLAAPAAVKLLDALDPQSENGQPRKKGRKLQDRLESLQRAASNPQPVIERVTKNFDENATPKTAAQAAIVTGRALQYLNEAAAPLRPRIDGGVANPVRREWAPSRYELGKFATKLRAVADPSTILTDLERGELTSDAVDAFRSVYPRLYEQTVSKIQDRIAEDPIEFDYRSRLQLSLLFSQPFDVTMQPKRLAAVAANYGTVSQDEAQAGANSGMVNPTVGGLKKLNESDRARTSSERLMMR